MKYLIIDACKSGTGIRDEIEGGYIQPDKLDLNLPLINRLNDWLAKYENEFYNGYSNKKLVAELDKEGMEIATTIKKELVDVKVSYFSDAEMKNKIIK